MTQVAYIELHDKFPNSGLVTLVLPILAGILLLESLIQACVENAKYWTARVVKVANEKRQTMARVRNVARR
ncbi:hypothetical protein CBS101457_002255 [Exobasidium rhododendri]|nr:hypothetical protein CBS101457_002255 [Exobasidium rhododendri]